MVKLLNTLQDMKATIHEAVINRCGDWDNKLGAHVREGHYDLVNSLTKEIVLPGLWNYTIKPGDSVAMSMCEYLY